MQPSADAVLNTFQSATAIPGITSKSTGEKRPVCFKFFLLSRNGNTIRASVVQKRITGGDGAKDVDEPTEIVVGEPDVTGDVIFNTVPGQTRIYIGHCKKLKDILNNLRRL